MIGDVIDHYRVLELVGRGAMGVVYKALDVNLDRTVAVKVMSAEARGDPDFVERFRQEARLQGALNHPNVALLFDYFIHDDGAPVAVMEFIDGESLEQVVRRRGAIPAHECIPVFKQALRGVAAAHRAGIIHRDLKPSNLMVTRDGIVKVMDFGIAKRQGAAGATHVSTSIGTTLYMAPEQILGRAIDCRTDVYALGISLYELLSGRPPFDPRGKAQYMILNAHVNDLPEPPTVHCPTIPQPVVDVVMRALAKDPAARFQSADDFMRALPDVAPPARRAVAGRVGPTGTVALEPSPGMGNDAAATPERTGTMAFEYAPTERRSPRDSMAVEYSAATLARESLPRRSEPAAVAPASAPPPASEPAGTPVAAGAAGMSAALPPRSQARAEARGPGWLVRTGRALIVTALAATLVVGTLMILRSSFLGTSAPRATRAQASPPPPAPIAVEPATPPAPVSSSAADPAEAPAADIPEETATAPAAPALAATTAPAQPDLSGTWSGAYVDATGKQLLRVVNLSIRRVHDDGGIDGTLQYEAASGMGWCKLQPRGSTYLALQRRLQLSPEGCSPHYPKELGVPLDFDRVNPQTDTLSDGRIEAPTGEVITVKLTRVSGV